MKFFEDCYSIYASDYNVVFKYLYMVGLLILYLSIISERDPLFVHPLNAHCFYFCCIVQTLRPRPPFRPFALADSNPALVRSRIISLSGSVRLAITLKKNRPIADEVSMLSCKEMN